jgi:hypothetical protein
VQQLTLAFEPGIAARHRSLRECVAAGVHRRGLGRVAGEVDMAPSALSEALGSADRRKFDVDAFEEYISKSGDLSPIYYLVDKFCRDPAARQLEALATLSEFAERLPAMLAAAGLKPSKARA